MGATHDRLLKTALSLVCRDVALSRWMSRFPILHGVSDQTSPDAGGSEVNSTTNLSQGFECEIDDRDWLSCQASSSELTISLISGDECVGGITIGRGQIQNLIDFLERSKEVVRA